MLVSIVQCFWHTVLRTVSTACHASLIQRRYVKRFTGCLLLLITALAHLWSSQAWPTCLMFLCFLMMHSIDVSDCIKAVMYHCISTFHAYMLLMTCAHLVTALQNILALPQQPTCQTAYLGLQVHVPARVHATIQKMTDGTMSKLLAADFAPAAPYV